MITAYTPSKRAAKVFPPGRFIARELEIREWSQSDFAQILGKTEARISDIIRGKRAITPDMAQLLAAAFGSSAEFWLNMESKYQLYLHVNQNTSNQAFLKAKIYDKLPIRELIKRGFLPETNNIDVLHQSVLRFLKVDSIDTTIPQQFCFRASSCVKVEQRARLAWCKIVENKALKSLDELPDFKPSHVMDAIHALEPYMEHAKDLSKVKDILKQFGILFLFEKHLEHTGVDGACCMMQQHPVIALTLRNDYVDSFWFTLMHELAHCLYGDYDNSEHTPNEARANQFAQKILVPDSSIRMLAAKCPYLSLQSIKQESHRINRHPSIVLGQLKNKKIVEYKIGARLREKASPHLIAVS